MRLQARRQHDQFSNGPGRSRKPLVGAVSIVLGVASSAGAYSFTGSTLLSAVLAALATFVAPAYYAVRMKPWKSAAASILASMLSGALAWSGIAVVTNGNPPGFTLPPIGVAFLAGLLTAGVISHAAASLVWASIIYETSMGGGIDPGLLSGALSLSLATTIGLIVFKARGDLRSLATPRLLTILLFSLVFLLLHDFLSPAG